MLVGVLTMKFLCAFSLSQIVLHKHRNEFLFALRHKINIICVSFSCKKLKSVCAIAIITKKQSRMVLINCQSDILPKFISAFSVRFTIVPIYCKNSLYFDVMVHFNCKWRPANYFKRICLHMFVVDVYRLSFIILKFNNLILFGFLVMNLLPIDLCFNYRGRLRNNLMYNNFRLDLFRLINIFLRFGMTNECLWFYFFWLLRLWDYIFWCCFWGFNLRSWRRGNIECLIICICLWCFRLINWLCWYRLLLFFWLLILWRISLGINGGD